MVNANVRNKAVKFWKKNIHLNSKKSGLENVEAQHEPLFSLSESQKIEVSQNCWKKLGLHILTYSVITWSFNENGPQHKVPTVCGVRWTPIAQMYGQQYRRGHDRHCPKWGNTGVRIKVSAHINIENYYERGSDYIGSKTKNTCKYQTRK